MTSQYVVICYKGKIQNRSYPGSCSRQVPNLFKLTKIGPPHVQWDPKPPL